jgi:hypothetical protein
MFLARQAGLNDGSVSVSDIDLNSVTHITRNAVDLQ